MSLSHFNFSCIFLLKAMTSNFETKLCQQSFRFCSLSQIRNKIPSYDVSLKQLMLDCNNGSNQQ